MLEGSSCQQEPEGRLGRGGGTQNKNQQLIAGHGTAHHWEASLRMACLTLSGEELGMAEGSATPRM